MTTSKMFMIFIILSFAILSTGCFHNDEDKSIDVSVINGTWFGVEEDVNDSRAGLNNICFKILNGKITQVIKEDQENMRMVDLQLVGSVIANTASIWSYTLNDETVGDLYIDASASHLTFVDDNFKFGVMQLTNDPAVITAECENINSNRVYVDNDVAANWTGFSVNVQNGVMVAFKTFASNVAVTVDTLEFLGADTAQSITGGNFAGNSLVVSNAMKGAYSDGWTNPVILDSPPAGRMTSFMSADKRFLAARLCLPFNQAPGNGVPDLEFCTFAAWNK